MLGPFFLELKPERLMYRYQKLDKSRSWPTNQPLSFLPSFHPSIHPSITSERFAISIYHCSDTNVAVTCLSFLFFVYAKKFVTPGHWCSWYLLVVQGRDSQQIRSSTKNTPTASYLILADTYNYKWSTNCDPTVENVPCSTGQGLSLQMDFGTESPLSSIFTTSTIKPTIYRSE